MYFEDEYQAAVLQHCHLVKTKVDIAKSAEVPVVNISADKILPSKTSRECLPDKQKVYGVKKVVQRKPPLSLANSEPLGKPRILVWRDKVLLNPSYMAMKPCEVLQDENDIFKTVGTVEDCRRREVVGCAIRSTKLQNLPPMSQGWVDVQLDAIDDACEVMIVGTPDLFEKCGVRLARGVINLEPGEDTARVMMANMSNETLLLPDQLVIGQLSDLKQNGLQLKDYAGSSCSGTVMGAKMRMEECAPSDLDWNIGPDLSIDERNDLLKLLWKYRDVFAAEVSELGSSTIAEHCIDTQGARPVHVPPRRTAHHLRQIINKELDEMPENGIVHPSKSPYASPIVIVTKKDGSMRFCVDYCQLNKQTKVGQYPLPCIDDALDSLTGARYFCTLDLASGYWQLKVADEDIQKTAFSCHRGLF